MVLLATPMGPNEKPRLIAESLINLLKTNMHKRRDPPYTSTNNKRIKTSPEPPPTNISIDLPPLPPELQRYKNSIVLLSNVSYEATREDILDLFKLYEPIEQTLKIRHDDRGQPTGDAIVACKTADEAARACSRLNGVNFMGRNVKAVLISP